MSGTYSGVLPGAYFGTQCGTTYCGALSGIHPGVDLASMLALYRAEFLAFYLP